MILLMIGAAFLIGFAAFSRWYRRIWNKNLSLENAVFGKAEVEG